VPYDLRKSRPYSIYDRFDFDICTRPEGDVWARFRVRMDEIYQSIRILKQALDGLPAGPVMPPGKKQHQIRVPAGEAYAAVEGPKGELGFYIVSDGKPNPYRYHVRAPTFINLTSLEKMCHRPQDRGQRGHPGRDRHRARRGGQVRRSDSMFGIGVLKGLGVTFKEFIYTYIDDIRKIPSRYAGGRYELDQSKASEQTGLFTIQYPEERRKVSERFRYIPILIYDAETGEDRCTACGICAKVCPPQCIWIVRAKDEKGKPLTRPAEFYIDTTICMNCGLCAEFCPFDAIKMDHNYKLADYERQVGHIYDLKKLLRPAGYYARIRPNQYAARQAAKREGAAKEG
jgi:NADH-quinone oxidoreductase subunit I